ncbi:MAG: tRNA lysidine(34) synthetase TilS, partial [Bdellovibrionales bacterium]|nr:tRNA lysidine(34) synthetase TilS [Bdellovibrionales bacterium]
MSSMVCRQSQIFEAVRELLDMLRADRNSLHVLAAISGGMDSMVLLQVLAELLKGGRLTCTVAHVNHRLRSESGSDEELVRAAAETQSMRFLCRQLEPRPPQTNLEAWARQERYRMLEEMRVECGAEIILTAHHRRDQAETVLMRTISGRLVTDAHSIAPYCPDRRLLRPLLNISHREIEAYAADKSVKFIQDASNSDLTRTRNYLRLSLMPQIRSELNPNLDEALSETASRLSTDEDFFEDLAERTAASFGSIVDLSKLLVLHDALLWRVCRSVAVRTCGEEARSIGYR